MSDDDFIAALNQAVKKEVVQRYMLERRIVEEEINLLHEDVCSWHGGHCGWEYKVTDLAGALLSAEAMHDFFSLAGLAPPEERPQPPSGLPRPKGLTRCSRYIKLIDEIYRVVWDASEKLDQEREAAQKLLEQVNADIKSFEANHDLMALHAYLRSLDDQELRRRKIMGVNFNYNEKAQAADALSFRPVSHLSLDLKPFPKLTEPDKLMARAKGLLRKICRENPQKVDALWI